MSPDAARDSSDILALGYLGNLTTLRELQQRCRFTDAQAAQACLVSPHTYRRWRHDRLANPTAVRLLAVLAGYLPWPGWEGWEMHNGFLFPPGYVRNGYRPGDIFAMHFERQMVGELRRQIRTIEAQADPKGLRRRA